MGVKSYSQHGEDTKLLEFIRVVETRDGVKIPRLVIEAGASDGTTNSNSRLFLEHGWRGILIEPHPECRTPLTSLWGQNAKVELVFKALADVQAPEPRNLYLATTPGHSSLLEKPGLKPVPVVAESLTRIAKASNHYKQAGGVGILSLDVEGLEMEVLPCVMRLRPAIVIIEANNALARERQRDWLGGVWCEIACNSVNSIYYSRDLMDFGKRYALKWKCK